MGISGLADMVPMRKNLSDGFGEDRAISRFSLLDRRMVCRTLLSSVMLASGPARAESWAEGRNALRIVVVKSQRKLMLVRAGNAFRTFPIALGAHPKGPKREAGDARTPEGSYLIDGFNEQSRYCRALHISYPNAEDLRRAGAAGRSPGGNIEIHGMPAQFDDYDPVAFAKDWTDGCIAVSNRAIKVIWASVSLDTPVDIIA